MSAPVTYGLNAVLPDQTARDGSETTASRFPPPPRRIVSADNQLA